MEVLQQYLKSERGRAQALAAILSVNPSAISQWSRVPAERVLDVERATGLSRYDLRPDIYGPAPVGTKRTREA